MISKRDLNIALLTQADVAATGTGYEMLAQMQEYTEQVNQGYIREALLVGDDQPMGLSFNSCSYQFGIYQLMINTPRVKESDQLDALAITDKIQGEFPRGLKLTHNGQSLRITTSSVRKLDPTDTHLKTALSVGFSVIN